MRISEKLKSFAKNSIASGKMTLVIEIAIALFVAGIILPIGLQQLASANLTGVNTAVATVVTVLLPVLAVIAIVYAFMRRGK